MEGESPHAEVPLSVCHDTLLAHELHTLSRACCGAGEEREDALARLDVLLSPGENLSGECLLEEALNVLEGGRVMRLCAHASGRVAWQVGSLALGGKGRGAPDSGSYDLEASGFTPSLDGHGGAPAYTVLLDGPGLCTCQRFTEALRGGAPSDGSGAGRLCRHLLAAHLARAALGTPSAARVRLKEISDEDMSRLLIRALTV